MLREIVNSLGQLLNRLFFVVFMIIYFRFCGRVVLFRLNVISYVYNNKQS